MNRPSGFKDPENLSQSLGFIRMRLITPFEITTSKLSLGKLMLSAEDSLNTTLLATVRNKMMVAP
jgi:hypothetical protein